MNRPKTRLRVILETLGEFSVIAVAFILAASLSAFQFASIVTALVGGFIAGIALTCLYIDEIREYYNLRKKMLRAWPATADEMEKRYKSQITDLNAQLLKSHMESFEFCQELKRISNRAISIPRLIEKELAPDVLPIFGARKGRNLDKTA